MSNRPQTKAARWARAAKNASKRLAKGVSPVLRHRNGEIARGEGNRNYPYGVRPGTHPSILTLHAQAERNKYPLVVGFVSGAPQPADWNALSRDDLRAEAKRRGLTGYGKLNKAGLVDLLVSA